MHACIGEVGWPRDRRARYAFAAPREELARTRLRRRARVQRRNRRRRVGALLREPVHARMGAHVNMQYVYALCAWHTVLSDANVVA